MNPANIHVFISGLFSDALLETARRVFGALGALSAGETFRIQPYRTENTPQHITVEASESLQSAVAIGIPAVRRDNPHYVPLRIAVMALGGYFGSRLMSNIREDKGLTYNISASL
ncbi:MAG: insulinase family protein, partial [Muribaculaceae bacterium]|nr:insulinase family protein [Muribaculaceae bacterium]